MVAESDLPEWVYSPDLDAMLHRQGEDSYVVDPRPPKPEWLEGSDWPPAEKRDVSSLETGDEIRMVPLVGRQAAQGESRAELEAGPSNPWGPGGGGGAADGTPDISKIGRVLAGKAAWDAAKGIFHWVHHHL